MRNVETLYKFFSNGYTMEVWRIKCLEDGRYEEGIYATRVLAIKAMPMLIEQYFRARKKKIDRHDIWSSVTKAQVLATGVYRHLKYGMHWIIESCELKEKKKYNWYKPQEEPDDWFIDSSLLKDKQQYELELIDSRVVIATFEEAYGIFSTDEEEIMIEDVIRFKEVRNLETAL